MTSSEFVVISDKTRRAVPLHLQSFLYYLVLRRYMVHCNCLMMWTLAICIHSYSCYIQSWDCLSIYCSDTVSWPIGRTAACRLASVISIVTVLGDVGPAIIPVKMCF